MLTNTLYDILGVLDSRIENLGEIKSDMDMVASLLSSALAEGQAQDILVLMGGEEDALEDILIGLEEEVDQVRKEELRDLTKQLKVMRKLVVALLDAVEDLDT